MAIFKQLNVFVELFRVGCLLAVVQSAKYCETGLSSWKYCSNDCCSDGLYDKCCTDTNIGLIIGCVVGAIFGLCFIGCIVCIICVVVNNGKRRQGTVIQPVSNTFIATNTSAHPYPQGSSQPQQGPPGYSQYPQYPPASSWQQNYSNPAYPPPVFPNNTTANQPTAPPNYVEPKNGH